MLKRLFPSVEPVLLASTALVVLLGGGLSLADAVRVGGLNRLALTALAAVGPDGDEFGQVIDLDVIDLEAIEDPRIGVTTVQRVRSPGAAGFLSARWSLPPTNHALLQLLDDMRQGMTRSRYTHGFRVDQDRGVYYFDCSGMAEWVLQQVAPVATESSRQGLNHRPLARNFYQRIASVAAGDIELGWQRVSRVADALPGDVIAWIKPEEIRSSNTGHIGFLVSKPEPVLDRPGVYLMQMADSTSLPHEDDERFSQSGFGSGTILLETDEHGQPVAYGWAGLRWRAFETDIAIGRPVR